MSRRKGEERERTKKTSASESEGESEKEVRMIVKKGTRQDHRRTEVGGRGGVCAVTCRGGSLS